MQLGAGTAIPTLSLLTHLLSQPRPPPVDSPQAPRRIHFTLADYNSDVLSIATVPNILLTWALSTAQAEPLIDPNPASGIDLDPDQTLDTSNLLNTIVDDLAQRNITFNFVSGAWSADFVSAVQEPYSSSSLSSKTLVTIILASETIYSPASLPSFTETLLSLLRPTHAQAHNNLSGSGAAAAVLRSRQRAFIAAKQIYFGVGGGVDEFVGLVEEKGGMVRPAWTTEEEDAVWEGGKRGGVERVILEVGLGEAGL